MKGLSLEVRVGLLILAALVLFGLFAVLIGGNPFESGFTIKVDFNNPGGLQPGASVNIGNYRIGRVTRVEYLGGRELDRDTQRRSLIRVWASINDEVRDTLHTDARFYVTSTSIVGESLLGVDPGSPELPLLNPDKAVLGIDPPRTDLAFAMMFEMLQDLHDFMEEDGGELRSLLHASSSAMRQLDGVFARNADNIDHIIENAERMSNDGVEIVEGANRLVNGPQLNRIMNNVDHTIASVSRDIDPILEDARSIADQADNLLRTVGPQQQEEIQRIIHNGDELVARANDITADAGAIVTHIREGRGTVGAILMEEELYDDISEMVRDLKHNPWKLFWRE